MESISASNSIRLREGSPMRLSEHLEERQESFNLEAYLLEHGYSTKGLISQDSVGCFSSSRARRSARSFSLSKFMDIRTALCRKLVSIGHVVRLKGRRNREEAESIEESEIFSSASLSSTEFSFHPEIRVEDTSTAMDGTQSHTQQTPQTNESATDRVIQWSVVKENKQCSPDSVLDEIEASQVYKDGPNRQEEHPSTSNFSLLKKPTEDSIFSASLWDLIVRNRREREGLFGPSNDTYSRHMSSKKALQQTRQLLFDCVREAVESRGRQRKTGELMGPEKLGRTICDNMQGWDRHKANRKTINRLLRSDLRGSIHEWGNIESLIGEIVKEVGDQILGQMKDEMVEEMVKFCICKTSNP